MPWKSEAQRRWMFVNKPEMAKRWAKETPKGAILPEHVADLKKPKSKLSRAFKKIRHRINKKKYGAK